MDPAIVALAAGSAAVDARSGADHLDELAHADDKGFPRVVVVDDELSEFFLELVEPPGIAGAGSFVRQEHRESCSNEVVPARVSYAGCQ